MKVAIIFDHPYGAEASENVPHRRSYSAALLAAVLRGLRQAGHEADLIDPRADGFNPVLSAEELAAWRQKKTLDPLVADYQRRLFEADHLVFLFPIWWEAMPALMKGFIDKVFVKGIIYEEVKPGRPFVSKLTRLEGVSLLTVMATPTFFYKLIFSSPVTKILFRGTFRKMGIHKLRWYNYSGMESRSLETRTALLKKTEQRFARL
ncbi:NAD(P)H-dependent oxidoreductase [Cohnella lubricantis]|uniref:NAD(P)H-dependent oxidoreductase n=1 Tax=Cohnella lubricantis TaxID=2163172 RepID=A0A841TCA9_9BACL|nr:NAD(P)H-dependent oxidoreductase [Cohnella lubricantis]MBB6676081.1 NAD(P)H-dependent oxidoreductase [Cohnella lubricantis]MBP2118036.1 putative NADPH-quinone reductase [Cohnella lubricantis]